MTIMKLAAIILALGLCAPTASLIGPAWASWDDQLAATLAAEREDGTT